MRVKITLAYDGANYYGFQHQKGAINIEDTLLQAISKVDSNVKKIYGSGRTDRYVHARGQVVHFDTDIRIKEEKWPIAINAYLPADIMVLEAKYVDDDFHARFSAIKKEYRYLIRYKSYDLFERNYMDYFSNINFEVLEKALKKFEGTHDFRGFCSAQIHDLKPTIKTIYEANLIMHDEYFELQFIGDGFLKYQVRKMTGTLIDVAIGKKHISIIDDIFESRDSKKSNRVLSGHGLYLMNVWY